MYNAIICRYHEIATKGHNRNMFERCLVDNIRHQTKAVAPCKVQRVRGRVWLEPKEERDFTPGEVAGLCSQLKKVFGLETFSPVVKLPVDMDAIREAAVKMAPEALKPYLEEKERITFRIRARRSNKRFPLRSQEVEIDLLSAIDRATGGGHLQLDLDNAEVTLGCEIRDEFSVLFWEQYQAPGGLPVGSNPKVLTMLSGGIDSPVAAYMVMKRGCATDYLTFHSSPYTPPETVDKVRGIAEHINSYQTKGTLYAANLAPLQNLIRDCCGERFRTVLYRRAMFRIAQMHAEKCGCRAIVTGEAVGQVASQTLVNMNTINRSIDMLVLRPLVGADKLETIRIAEEIGTFEMSSVQVPDSCTVFAPSSPSTAVPVGLAEAEELKIPDYALEIEKIVENIEKII